MSRYAFLTGFPITIDKPEILNWIWVESLETINKAMQFVFHRDNGEITKLFFQNISTTTVRGNVPEMWILKKWILRIQQKKIMDFEYCEEDLRSILNKILL